jgi:hypothetical protein
MTSCEEAAEDEEVGFDKWVRIVGGPKVGPSKVRRAQLRRYKRGPRTDSTEKLHVLRSGYEGTIV